MEFGLTIPMRRVLKLGDPLPSQREDKSGCWDLHIIELRGAKTVIAVHCISRYTAVLWDIGGLDVKELFSAVREGIKASLLAAGFDAEVTEQYMLRFCDTGISRTHGRREVAFLNRAWFDLLEADLLTDTEQRAQPRLEEYINTQLCRCAGYAEKDTALAHMRRCFAEFERQQV